MPMDFHVGELDSRGMGPLYGVIPHTAMFWRRGVLAPRWVEF